MTAILPWWKLVANTAETLLREKGRVKYDELAVTHYAKHRLGRIGDAHKGQVLDKLRAIAEELRRRGMIVTLVNETYFNIPTPKDMDAAARCLPSRHGGKGIGLHLTLSGSEDVLYGKSRQLIGQRKMGGLVVESRRVKEAITQNLVPARQFTRVSSMAISLHERAVPEPKALPAPPEPKKTA